MSQHLPVLSVRQIVAAFECDGWGVDGQRSSHVVMTKAGEAVSLSIPDHREVAGGTLSGLIRNAGLTVDEFIVLSRSK